VLIFSVDGNGVVLGKGIVSLKPAGSEPGFFSAALEPATLLALLTLLAANRRRRGGGAGARRRRC